MRQFYRTDIIRLLNGCGIPMPHLLLKGRSPMWIFISAVSFTLLLIYRMLRLYSMKEINKEERRKGMEEEGRKKRIKKETKKDRQQEIQEGINHEKNEGRNHDRLERIEIIQTISRLRRTIPHL